MNGNLQTDFDPWFEDPNFADSYAMRAFAQSASDASKRRWRPRGSQSRSIRGMRTTAPILSNIYLANREPDQALPILQSLEQTVKAEMASQVARAKVAVTYRQSEAT